MIVRDRSPSRTSFLVINMKTFAHLFRRTCHVSMIFIAVFYYYFLIHFADIKIIHLSLLAFIFFVFLFEKLRIRGGFILFGQRDYEMKSISAFAWTMLSLVIIFFFAPVKFAMPIVTTCALVDPLLGELRSRGARKLTAAIIGTVFGCIIWLFFSYFYHFPIWIGFILSPLAVLVEWPTIRWVDDNALMLLVPLAMVMCVL